MIRDSGRSDNSCFIWPPPRRRVKLIVAIPGSVLRVDETLLLKAVKAGLLARSLAFFRVDECYIYRDPDTQPRDVKILSSYLHYILVPPHLRKKAVPITRVLRASGVLPPLRTYNHIVSEELKEGDVLDGFVEDCSIDVCKVYLGKPGYGVIHGKFKPGSIITVKVVAKTGDVYNLVRAEWGQVYTGFKIKLFKDLAQVVNQLRRDKATIILASKYGRCFSEIADKLKEAVAHSGKACIIFGGPYRCPYEYTDRGLYDFIVNTIPRQGTLTVRTEEAIIATLSAMENSRILGD